MGRVTNQEILILNWRDILHPLGGGAEQSLFEHAKKWAKKGIKVTWFSATFKGYKKIENISGVKFIRAGSQYTVHFYAFLYYVFGRLGSPKIVIDSYHGIPFFSPLYVRNAKIIALINEVAGQIWFLNTFLPLAALGYLLELLSFLIYKKNIFITASKSTVDALLHKGISRNKIHIINHGVTISRVSSRIVKRKNPTILFLSRISEDKGIKEAITAFGKVLDYCDAEFWVVGKEEKKGILKEQIKNLLSKEKLQKIKYFGYVSQRKKFEILKQSWILVHPSKKEGWGLNVIEAASQFTPTVGFNVEGLRDSIVNDKTGILCSPNAMALAENVIQLLKDRKKRIKMGIEANKWSRNFAWDKSTRDSYALIKKFL